MHTYISVLYIHTRPKPPLSEAFALSFLLALSARKGEEREGDRCWSMKESEQSCVRPKEERGRGRRKEAKRGQSQSDWHSVLG